MDADVNRGEGRERSPGARGGVETQTDGETVAEARKGDRGRESKRRKRERKREREREREIEEAPLSPDCSPPPPPTLGFELRAFILSHSTSSIFVKNFSRYGLMNYLPGLASNHDPPDLCLLSS
jgi:hypothetical protein